MLAFISTLFVASVTAQEIQPQPVFNISLEGGCLRCGSPCLSAVIAAVPECIAPGLAVGGAISGVPLDLNISSDVFRCVKTLVGSLTVCRECLESLVCCVTDSCNFCECDCHNLLRFAAPLSSPTREEHPWLFNPEVGLTL